jgi:diguanylate cyclase (GGDEF)-like protein/PAS domain S-box-containing protein
LIVAVWGTTLSQLQATERTEVNAATHDLVSFVAFFEQFTRRAIKDADRMARLVKYEFETQGRQDLRQLIRAGALQSDGLFQVSIFDASGNVVDSSVPTGRINVADREYFKLHAAQDSGLLDISKPVVARGSGRSVILLSRRINNPDGSFAGVVSVSVAPDYFTQFYSEADLGSNGSLELVGLDGTYRARRVGGKSTSVADDTGAALVARAELSPSGLFEATSADDGVTRFVAYSKLPDYPFIVTAAQARDEALVDFLKIRTNQLLFAALATIAILLFFSVVTVLAVRLQRHRRELKLQRHFLQTLVDNLPSGIAVHSTRPHDFGQHVLWNEASEALFGIKAEDALGKTSTDILEPDAAARVVELDRDLLASPMIQEAISVHDVRIRGRRLFHFVRSPIFGVDNEVDYIMSSATDITEERARTDELRLASKVFETTADGIMLTDSDDRIIMVNAAFSRLTGYAAEEMLGKVLAESPFRPLDVAESDARMVDLHRQGFATGEVPRLRKDGTPLSLWLTKTCVRDVDGRISNYIRVFTDISLLKATQQKLEQLASFDTLTGLPNRRLLLDRFDQGLLRAERNATRMALLFIDLDGFKQVNDTLGHDIGDLLLREVALRLQKCIRASDSVGRFGGDEFAIVLEDTSLPEDAVHVGERIVEALAAPFLLNGHRVRTAASIGIALYPSDGADAATLLKNADVAMYRAKRSGRNRFEFFSPEHADQATAA